MKNFTYHQPTTVATALPLLADQWGKAELLAGGTDLLDLQKEYVAQPGRVVSVTGINALGNVAIDGQKATTGVDQEFSNPNNATLEGEYLFPIPKGAQIDKFTMRVGDRDLEAELLDASKARAIYEEIVRKCLVGALRHVLDEVLHAHAAAGAHRSRDAVRRGLAQRRLEQTFIAPDAAPVVAEPGFSRLEIAAQERVEGTVATESLDDDDFARFGGEGLFASARYRGGLCGGVGCGQEEQGQTGFSQGPESFD